MVSLWQQYANTDGAVNQTHSAATLRVLWEVNNDTHAQSFSAIIKELVGIFQFVSSFMN